MTIFAWILFGLSIPRILLRLLNGVLPLADTAVLFFMMFYLGLLGG